MRDFVKLLSVLSCLWAAGYVAAQEDQDQSLRLNQIQVIGTHNSYKLDIDPQVAKWVTRLGNDVSSLEYGHEAIPFQLERGLGNLELDLLIDREGGRYAEPVALEVLGLFGADSGALSHGGPDMDRPGIKVLHIQDLDYRSSCLTFEICLAQLRTWSEARPDHLPVFVTMNFKSGESRIPGGVDAPTWTEEGLLEAEAALLQHLGPERLLTPDDARGDHTSLADMVAAADWPDLAAARGKFLFIIDQKGPEWRSMYASGPHEGLKGRLMFLNLPPGDPGAAIVFRNDPAGSQGDIRGLVQAGYIVRTRADADTREARAGDLSRFEAARDSGAQIITTDYHIPTTRFGSAYQVIFEDGNYSRCNPLLARDGCQLTNR